MGKGRRKSNIEGVAIHDGPESCVGVREDDGEALTGVRAGWAIEPRNQRNRGADVVNLGGRQHLRRRYTRVVGGPRAVGDPTHVRNFHAREPGDLALVRSVDRGEGRSGKAEAVILR
jgi:hypothetical protein